jgi:hypothetical protein
MSQRAKERPPPAGIPIESVGVDFSHRLDIAVLPSTLTARDVQSPSRKTALSRTVTEAMVKGRRSTQVSIFSVRTAEQSTVLRRGAEGGLPLMVYSRDLWGAAMHRGPGGNKDKSLLTTSCIIHH